MSVTKRRNYAPRHNDVRVYLVRCGETILDAHLHYEDAEVSANNIAKNEVPEIAGRIDRDIEVCSLDVLNGEWKLDTIALIRRKALLDAKPNRSGT